MVSSAESDQIFANLKTDPENEKCVDCSADHPNFASVSHGSFICADCVPSHSLLSSSVSRVKSLQEQWSTEDLKYMISGGNSALKEFLGHYNLLYSPPNFKYLTKAAFFYREMLSVVAQDQEFNQNCPGIDEGIQIVGNVYPDLGLINQNREEIKTELLPNNENRKKTAWDYVKGAYNKSVEVGNKAADKLNEKMIKFSQKPAVKKVEDKTKQIAGKIEVGLNKISEKVYSKPGVQNTISQLNYAADSFAREVQFTINKINSNPKVTKMKQDTMKLLKDYRIYDSGNNANQPNLNQPNLNQPNEPREMSEVRDAYVPPPYVPPPYAPPSYAPPNST